MVSINVHLRAYKLNFGALCYQSKFIERFGPLIAVGAHNLKFGALYL